MKRRTELLIRYLENTGRMSGKQHESRSQDTASHEGDGEPAHSQA